MKQLSIQPNWDNKSALIMWMDENSGGNIILTAEELRGLYTHMKPTLILLGYDIGDL